MDASLLIGRETLGVGTWVVSDRTRLRCVHLVGIAGSGMRALADVLAQWGWRVSGSDCSVDGARALASAGVQLFAGHAVEQIPPETDLVVYSDAVPAENPELRRAAAWGIPTISYFDVLGRLSAAHRTSAVAGTHGKSTTTAMAAHILVEAGRDPTVFCGAAPIGKVSGGRAGGSRPAKTPELQTQPTLALSQIEKGLMLVEACEYRANFLKLRPQHAAVLNIEPDHFDCYESLDQIEEAFGRFVALLPPDGRLLVRHDCQSARRAAVKAACRVETFGFCPEADWSAVLLGHERGRVQLEIRHLGRALCAARLQMPGLHNAFNALAAAALAWAEGAAAEQIGAGLASFAGLHRRLEFLGTHHGVDYVDDYAHHPTEAAAALKTVRSMFPHRRVWCIFQPHQASRTARLLDELAASLQNADRLIVAEIYRAREGEPRPGEVAAADLARAAAVLGVETLPVHAADEIVQTLKTHLVPGDVVVTLGAGDVRPLRPAMETNAKT